MTRNQTISHTVNKSEEHPVLSQIAKFISLSIVKLGVYGYTSFFLLNIDEGYTKLV